MTTDSQREDGRVMTEPRIGVVRPQPEEERGRPSPGASGKNQPC